MYYKRNLVCILILITMQAVYTISTCKYLGSYEANYCVADVVLNIFHPFYFGLFVAVILTYNIFSETKDDMMLARVVLRGNRKKVMLNQLKHIVFISLTYTLIMLLVGCLISLAFTDTAINWNLADSYFAKTKYMVLDFSFLQVTMIYIFLMWARCLIICVGLLVLVWADVPKWIPFIAILALGGLENCFSSLKIFQNLLTPNIKMLTNSASKIVALIYVLIVSTAMILILKQIVRKKEFYAKEI